MKYEILFVKNYTFYVSSNKEIIHHNFYIKYMTYFEIKYNDVIEFLKNSCDLKFTLLNNKHDIAKYILNDYWKFRMEHKDDEFVFKYAEEKEYK